MSVSAAVSLAAIGPDLTRIRIMAVPGLERNFHDIEVGGEFGRLQIHHREHPDRETWDRAAGVMGSIRMLPNLVSSLQIGT